MRMDFYQWGCADVIIVLLIGGNKSSQARDIDKAKKLAADM